MFKFKERVTDAFVWDILDLDASDSRRFGGKATGLACMAAAGIPVPPAFVVGTDAFHAFRDNGRQLPSSLASQVDSAIKRLGAQVGRTFSGKGAPLLVSVRSGSQVSMPGMMDTILNLGLDARSAALMIAQTRNAPFVIDTWMRFWRMFADIVLGIDGEPLAEAVASARAAAEKNPGPPALAALEQAILKAIAAEGESAPTDPRAQLDLAISAVFTSWDSARAKAYRKHHGIPDDLGTAVTVQAMVFGNADEQSGSGVAFTRNPNTGERALYGEYLPGRQGEDLVSGARTPIDLAQDATSYAELRRDLEAYGRVLEALYRDAVDIEFTVERGNLYLLQVRPAKRTALAAVRIATDFIDEGHLSAKDALRLVSAEQVRRLLRPVFDPTDLAIAKAVTKGIGSSPGNASGVAVVDSDRAAERAAAGDSVILVRPTTSPLDIRGMLAADGIVTARGGALSHAAVVSRALDTPCVVGCAAIDVDVEARTFTIDGRVFHEGDPISVDGTEGFVFDRGIKLVSPTRETDRLARLLTAADEVSGAALWLPARDAAEAAALPEGAQGFAVVCLTDVAIAAGLSGELASHIGRLGQAEATTAEKDLQDVTQRAALSVLSATRDHAIHVRLPRPTSERARVLVPNWSDLDPRIYLPLGYPSFYKSILQGLSEAARATNGRVTALLSGVTDPAEWRRYQQILASFNNLEGGVAVQNIAGLDAAPAMIDEGAVVWLDMDELIRSSHGFLSELRFASATFADYIENGFMTANPRTVIKPFMASLLQRIVQSGDEHPGRAGIDCGTACDPTLIGALYGFGFRNFSVPVSQWEIARLRLAQQKKE